MQELSNSISESDLRIQTLRKERIENNLYPPLVIPFEILNNLILSILLASQINDLHPLVHPNGLHIRDNRGHLDSIRCYSSLKLVCAEFHDRYFTIVLTAMNFNRVRTHHFDLFTKTRGFDDLDKILNCVKNFGNQFSCLDLSTHAALGPEEFKIIAKSCLNLTSFAFGPSEGSLIDLNCLSSLTKLETLIMWALPNLISLASLSALKNLRELKISHLTKTIDMSIHL